MSGHACMAASCYSCQACCNSGGRSSVPGRRPLRAAGGRRGAHLRQLAHARDGPAAGDERVGDGPDEGRHGGHGDVGDERQQAAALHAQPQAELEVAGQPGEQRVVAPVVAEVRHDDRPHGRAAQEQAPGHLGARCARAARPSALASPGSCCILCTVAGLCAISDIRTRAPPGPGPTSARAPARRRGRDQAAGMRRAGCASGGAGGRGARTLGAGGGRGRAAARDGRVRLLRPHQRPGQAPGQAQQREEPEHRRPAERVDQRPADEQPDRRAQVQRAEDGRHRARALAPAAQPARWSARGAWPPCTSSVSMQAGSPPHPQASQRGRTQRAEPRA